MENVLESKEMSEEELNLRFVSKQLTETDKILEQEVTGALRVWHIIFIVCAAILATS